MTNYLGDCSTIEDLALKRNSVIAEINKEFADKRKVLVGKVPDFRKVEFMQVPFVIEPMPVYAAMQFTEGQVPHNVIRLESGSIAI